MAYVPEVAVWEEGIRRFELFDFILGGDDGVDNIPLKQIANRTLYLKGLLIDLLQDQLAQWDAIRWMQEQIESGAFSGPKENPFAITFEEVEGFVGGSPSEISPGVEMLDGWWDRQNARVGC